MAKSKLSVLIDIDEELSYIDSIYQELPKKVRKLSDPNSEIQYLEVLYSPATDLQIPVPHTVKRRNLSSAKKPRHQALFPGKKVSYLQTTMTELWQPTKRRRTENVFARVAPSC